ncbi:MAG: restriction endonuclease subunit S, partial [Spirochaetes bacterium]|nr:restriction endonuclease subunit S [Spirochaetota bacterium]
MKNWIETPIKEIYDSLYDGPHATPKPTESGKIFLKIDNITEDGHLDFTKIRFISEEEFPRWTKRVKPKQYDIVFSYEATLGRYAIIPKDFEGCLGRRIALIRPNNKKGFYKFLYYYFFSSLWKIELGNYLITGATVDRIPLLKFPKFKIFLPPPPIQRKIAAVLSAYDDLIENNNRRIAFLEKMAEELYREWFVRLRFPGHEKVKVVKGVPEGWEVKKISEIVDFLSGFSFKSKTYLP